MKKIAILFPGQGSQFVGMGKKLCDNYSIARQIFEEANEAVGFDIKKLCFEGDISKLTETENTQPAILTASYAAFRVFMQELGVEPVYCAGHSLGEFSALTCTGAINFSDAVSIVKNRGKFMQEAVPIGVGAMSAVSGVSKGIIEEECKAFSNMTNVVVISNYNSPDQIIISGHEEAVQNVTESLKKMSAKVTRLKVSAPFHSPLMQLAADRLKDELMRYSFNDLKYQVLSNVTALPYRGKDEIIENLTKQIVQPVQWQSIMEYIDKSDVEAVIELGPKTVLRGLAKANVPGINAFSYDDERDVTKIEELLKQTEKTDKDAKLKLIIRCLAIAVCTKNSNWDNEEYYQGVVDPYRKVQSMLEEIERDNLEPTMEQMTNALEMLKSVFKTKNTQQDEQKDRFEQIFNETGLKNIFPNFQL